MTSIPKAILFGAIGTLVETSELQRRSFNAAFRDAELEWEWGREDYKEMLRTPGGVARIAAYAEEKRQEVDAELIHKAKVAHFRAVVRQDGLTLRPGVADVMAMAVEKDVALGFATTTGSDTVDLLFDGLDGQIKRQDFSFVGDRDLVSKSKPSSEIYRLALSQLALVASDVIAIEDTPESAKSAVGAGIECIGFPGEAARGRTFPEGVTHIVDRLEPVFCGISRL